MKKWLLTGLIVLLVGMVSGFSDSVVKEDLENYFETTTKVTNKLEKDLETQGNKMSKAETPEQVIPILEEMRVLIAEAQTEMSKFSPKSDEVKFSNQKVQDGLTGLITAVDGIIEAMKAEDQSAMIEHLNKMNESVEQINAAENDMVKLANEKGLKIQL